jgi:parallel beta-helix repeat protein/predicted outer membrane repeat protein
MRNCFTIAAIAILLIASLSFGADYYVDAVNGLNSNTGTSVDKAWQTITIALSQVSGTTENPVTIHIANGTYNKNIGESFPLVMENFVNLKGANREATIIDASGSEITAVSFTEGVNDVTCEGITITGGSNVLGNGGGIYCYYASPVIRDSIIKENVAKNGAGIYLQNSKLSISDCNIEKNTQSKYGSGIYMVYSNPTIMNCIISENATTWYGAGIYCFGSTPMITNSEFKNNNADGLWGGAFFLDKSGAQINNCLIKGNTASYGAGLFSFFGSPGITNCTFTENISLGDGGALSFQDSTSSAVTDCVIENNQAYNGGGIYCNNSSYGVVISNCRIEGNKASNAGGGFHLFASPITLKNILVAGNEAKYGGGIYFDKSSLTLRNFTIADNIGSVNSAGINVYSTSVVTMIDSILWGAGETGLITKAGESQLNITYSDVEGNFEGQGNKNANPLFTSGPLGGYYLSQSAAGQSSTSVCVDSGSDTATNLLLDTLTTRTDKVTDSDQLDMGYHYPISGGNDNIEFGLKINPDSTSFSSGDNFSLILNLHSPSKNTPIDLYFVLLNVNTNKIYFGFAWNMTPAAVLKNFNLPANYTLADATIMNIIIPSQKPPLSSAGSYVFAIGASKPGTFDFISNIATAGFKIQ